MPITRNIRSTRQAEDPQPAYPGRRINSSATPPSPTSTLPLMVDPIYSPTTPEASSPEVYQRRAKRHSPVSRKSPDHIRRPRNAFIIFRSHMYQTLKSDSVQLPGDRHQNQQNELSKMAAKAWKNMEEHERQPFTAIALTEKAAHKIKYPNYVYAPGGKPGSGKPKAPKKATSTRRKKLVSASASPPPPPPPPPPVHYDFPFHHPPRRAAAQRASEKISQMDARTPPSSVSSGSDVQMEIDDDFIPTSEIPPLDLNATVETEQDLQYPDLENYLDGYSNTVHYTSDGNFSSDSASTYFDFQPHLKCSSEFLLPNSLLPISLSFNNSHTLEVGTHDYTPDVFDITAGYGDFPLLDADYQPDQPQWGADASVAISGGQQDWSDYIDYNQFSS